jgi:hypothetical protein
MTHELWPRAVALAVALAVVVTFGCTREPDRPNWRRTDGSDFARDDLERDHSDCLKLYGKPDRRDGNDMARWIVSFGGCMHDRGWEEAAP